MLLIAGCLIYELFSGGKLTRTEDLRNIASIPKVSFHDCIQVFWLVLELSHESIMFSTVCTVVHYFDMVYVTLKVNDFYSFCCSLCFQITRSSWVLHLLVEWTLQNLLTTVVSSIDFPSHFYWCDIFFYQCLPSSVFVFNYAVILSREPDYLHYVAWLTILTLNFRVFPEQIGRDHPVHGSS